MHIIGGILLVIVAFAAVYFIYASGVLEPAVGPLATTFNIHRATSTASNNSEFYKQVRINSVQLGQGLDKTQVVSLIATPTTAEGITITGWSLRTDIGAYAIPKVQNVYSPSVSGVPPENIYVRTGSVVNFYSGKNPQKDQAQAIRAGLNEWRIWLGNDFLALHGKILLKDDKGKLVDEYDYLQN